MTPWVERVDVDADPLNDDVQICLERGAPRMYLYFDSTDAFKTCVICADQKQFICESSFSNAMLSFLAVFYVCGVGYHPCWEVFMNIFEKVLIGAKFNPKEYVSINVKKFLTNWQ